jgi:hypothetical protein
MLMLETYAIDEGEYKMRRRPKFDDTITTSSELSDRQSIKFLQLSRSMMPVLSLMSLFHRAMQSVP